MEQNSYSDDDFFSVFGVIIRQFRLERGLNQEQAAKLCGFSLKKWNSLENCNDIPPKNTMIKICERFNVPQEIFRQRLALLIDEILAQHHEAQKQHFTAP